MTTTELFDQGRWTEGYDVLRAEIEATPDPVEAARLKIAIVDAANDEDWSRGLHNRWLKHGLLDEVDVVAAANPDEDALGADALFQRGMALHIDFIMAPDGEALERERESFARAAELYDAAGDDEGAAFALAMLGIYHHVDLLDRETARPLLQQAFDRAPADRPTYARSEAARHLGQIQQELGDPAGALPMLEESYRQREGASHERHLAAALHALGSARLDAGDFDGAERDLARAREIAERWGAVFILPLIARTEADLAFARLAPGVWRRSHP
jgi:tetratricopeptide (TPR) repeat protein